MLQISEDLFEEKQSDDDKNNNQHTMTILEILGQFTFE